MDDVLWPDDPRRSRSGDEPPYGIETRHGYGDSPRIGVVLVSRADALREALRGSFERCGLPVSFSGPSLLGARSRVRGGGPWFRLQVYADGWGWSEMGRSDEEPLDAAAARHFGVHSAQGAWLAASLLEVCVAPKGCPIMPLTRAAAFGADIIRGECAAGLLESAEEDFEPLVAEGALRRWTSAVIPILPPEAVPLACDLALAHQMKPFHLIAWGRKDFEAALEAFDGCVLLFSVILRPGEDLPGELAERAGWVVTLPD